MSVVHLQRNAGKGLCPRVGEMCYNPQLNAMMVWDGVSWKIVDTTAPKPVFAEPTEEQMTKYPALRESWEAYLITKKLVGV